jgi:arylsulfatase A-like enzyme
MAGAIACTAALIEVVVLTLDKRGTPLLRLGTDYPWMAPVALIVTVALSLLPWLAIGMWTRSRLVILGLLFTASAVTLLNTLMLVRGMSHYAAALLAAGAAVQIARVLERRLTASLARRVLSISAVSLAVVIAALMLWSPAMTPTAAAGEASGRPNVLLVTLDTVRAFSSNLYGYERQTTPRLEQFAARGVVFDRAFSTAPWTLPSHASLFTGRWPHELSTGYETTLDGAYPTLAEYLSSHGYRTAGFAANLGYVGRDTGLARGFSHYEDYQRSLGEFVSSSTLLRRLSGNFRLRALIQNDQHVNRIDAADLSARALDWIAEDSQRPFFAFLNYFDAHEPYLPDAPYDTAFGPPRAHGRLSPLHRWLWDPAVDHRPMSDADVREEHDAYDGALASLDAKLGAFLSELERRGVLQNTLVVITADHGEEFGEHGVFEHGYSLYRPALQVPLVVVAPASRVPVARVSTAVTLRDVPATVVELAGVGAGAPFPGVSLSRFWTSAPPPDTTDTLLQEVERARGQPDWFPSSRGAMKSAIHGGVHCIRDGAGREELYDLDADPWERTDLAARAEYAERLTDCRTARDRLALPASSR